MNKNYTIIINKEELKGTCYFELLPGKYQGKCWNDNSIFIKPRSFDFLEDILCYLLDSFDRYQFTELSIDQVKSLINILDDKIIELESKSDYKFIYKAFSESHYYNLKCKIKENKFQILFFLKDLKEWLSFSIK